MFNDLKSFDDQIEWVNINEFPSKNHNQRFRTLISQNRLGIFGRPKIDLICFLWSIFAEFGIQIRTALKSFEMSFICQIGAYSLQMPKKMNENSRYTYSLWLGHCACVFVFCLNLMFDEIFGIIVYQYLMNIWLVEIKT